MAEPNLIRIRPGGRFFNLELSELWKYRELLYFLTLRDIQIRYKQTAIGIIWALLQPLLTTAVFAFVFMQFARSESPEVPYPLLALSGVLVWLFINTAISNASNSLVGNSNLVTKVYFPRLIVPISASLAGLIDLLIALILLGCMMAYFGVGISYRILFAPLFIVMAAVFAISAGILFSALNVRFRDIKHALPFALQVGMFISPVFYPSSVLSENWRFALSFNPVSGILDGFRSALFGLPFDWRAIGISAVGITIVLLLSLFTFKSMEEDFADLI